MTERPLVVAYVVDRWQQLSETFIREEVATLRGLGTEVVVVALGAGDLDPPAGDGAIRLDLVAAAPGHRWSTARHLLLRPLATARLAVALARMRPESPHWKRSLPSVAATLAHRRVQWVHAHFAWEASGVAQALAAMLGTGWSMTAHANDIFVRNHHLGRKLAQIDHLVTVCRYNVEQLDAAHGPLPDTHVVVCGVNVPPPSPTPPTPDIDVLAVGRLVPKKGFDLLVRAAALLVGDRPDLRIVVVGDGPERPALEALIDELGVRPNVRFAGSMEHGDALHHLARAAVVCLPARIAPDGDRDSMPVVLKEAMAAGVPVVGTAVVAIPEMVDNEVGRLVAPEDPEALARALAELVDDPQERARLGAAGRRRVQERFTLDAEVARLRELFTRWAEGSARPGRRPRPSTVEGPPRAQSG